MKIYLAGPYSHEDDKIKESRFVALTRAAGIIVQKNHHVMSPITHSHPIAMYSELPGSWEYWREMDLEFIRWCDEMWVYHLPGWERSIGLNEEKKIAGELNKPIKTFRDEYELCDY